MAKLDLGYKKVELYTPGALVKMPKTGKVYEIVKSTILWEQYNEPVQMLTLSEVDDEGDNIDDTTIEVNSDMYDFLDV